MGCIEDSGNHKRITPLLRFFTSKSEEELKSLDEYIENMGENQKAIYYLATDSLRSAKTAPFLEKLVQKDIEVFSVVNILFLVICSYIAVISKVETLCYYTHTYNIPWCKT